MIFKKIENSIGELCKYLIPIKHEYYLGNGKEIAICTLSSIKLLLEISNDIKLMNKVAIVGRLLSENKGIDKIIRYCLSNKEVAHLIVCGNDGRGHRAGDALIALSNNGITKECRIIMSRSPCPRIISSFEEVEMFRNRITVHNLIEQTNLEFIRSYLDRFG